MWSFKKRRPPNLLEELLSPVRPKVTVHDTADCPDLMVKAGLCVCINCPQRGTCVAEQLAKCSPNCSRCIRYCSYKTHIMSGNGDCSKWAMEEFSDRWEALLNE